jgi:DUF1680 family protein
MNIRIIFMLAASLTCSLALHAQKTGTKTIDKLHQLPAGASEIKGYLGEKMNLCIQNGIMNRAFELYIKPFEIRNDDPSKWQGEFWGKWFTSAALVHHYHPSGQHRKIIDDATAGMIRTQDATGKLSSYKKDFGDWDIWGRKYAILGLVAHFDETGNKASIEAAARSVDNLISILGPGKRKITETGLSLLEALSSSSVLEPVVLVYQRTGEKKYLDFAKYIVKLWSEPNAYTPSGMKLVEDALASKDPILISSPKGYEQMSCYEGLCELFRATGDSTYLKSVIKFAHAVRKKEIMVVGSGSSGELWCDGAMRQTEMLEQTMETCVTATWIKLCNQLLRLTGDPVWADEMEISIHNALLGAMTADGSWWAYFSPLTGERVPSHLQVPSCQTSCCVANGPRALMTIPAWAVMTDNLGAVVNLYETGIWNVPVKDGRMIKLEQKTTYPEENNIKVHVSTEIDQRFRLRLRVPSWSKTLSLTVNGKNVQGKINNGYVSIDRKWKDGDLVEINLDLRGRVIKAPGNPNQMAIMRGPIVLALDNRIAAADDRNLWLLHEGYQWKHDKSWNIDYALLKPVSSFPNEMYIDLKRVPSPKGIRMAFEVPYLLRPTHFVKHEKTSLIMCDYASAGNQYETSNAFRVWLPQPLYMRTAYPQEAWRSLYQREDKRPGIPMLSPAN